MANIANADFNPDHVYAIAILSPAVVRRADGQAVGGGKAREGQRRFSPSHGQKDPLDELVWTLDWGTN